MSEDQFGAAIRSAAVRGVVTESRVGPRTLLLVTGLDDEVANVVELLLPPGYSARPATGADILMHQVLGARDHLVATGGDMIGQAIPDLQAGEFGMAGFGAQVVWRNTGHVVMRDAAGTTLELMNDGSIKLTGDLHVTGAVIAGYGGSDQVGLLTHDHGGVEAGGANTTAPIAGS